MKTLEKIIGLKDLRLNTNSYINAINKGHSFIVVRRSRPIFKVVPVDEWGDEGIWETVADFTNDKRGGIPAKEFLEALQDFRKKNG
ncbi:MAG: type II toxin-antitoxin system prevent-host-death family antitoxin [Patescibacteria group bacterium]